MLSHFKGEFAALGAAFLWAVASLLYGRATLEIPPRTLNLIKGVLAILLFGLTLILSGSGATTMSTMPLVLLMLSGVLGIGLGDTAYFEALKALGARRALLMETLAPPLTATIALLFLGETLTSDEWLGIGLTVCGVAWVISEQVENDDEPYILPWRGIVFGLLAAGSQSVGAVLSRLAFTQATVSPLWSALLRLAAGVGFLLLWSLFSRSSRTSLSYLKGAKHLWGIILFATFSGTYLGIWLQQASLKFTNAGTAQTLLATSQIFVLLLSAGRGESISPRALTGTAVAVIGVAVLFGIG
jgi:drug/metabolite transporter (DMT)-like permease